MPRAILIITTFVFIFLDAFSQTKSNQRIIVKTLDFAYLEGCETGKGECKPIEIFRLTKYDSVILVFPSGGTESDVYLGSAIDNTIKLHDKKYSGQGKPILNLTNLKDGEYSAGIISCGLGGSCIIRLKTKPE